MAVVLGLLVAITYGIGDFFGGMGSKKNPPTAVVAASQGCGLLVLAVVVLVDRGAQPILRHLLAGAGAGSVGLIGVILLYRGLATGSMSVVAPITAVGAAIVPLTWGLVTGERPSGPAMAGVVLALVAVVLVSSPDTAAELTDGAPNHKNELVLALGAGAAFGVVFVLLGTTEEASGLWPVFAARVASVSLIMTGLLVTHRQIRPARGTEATVAGAGVLDVTANALYVIAVREGLLSLVSVLSSLYPAATVVLARIVLKERMGKRQLGGIALALAGVALIARG